MGEIVEINCTKFNTSCKVHLFGSTVISWKCDEEELLFVSCKSNTTNPKKAIRGGIPLIFPNFGPWENGPQHGFARIQWWTVKEQPSELPSGDMRAVFVLSDNEETKAMWNYSFKLYYTVTVGEHLKTDLQIENTGDNEFDFTCLLHTYFRVPDIAKVTVSGLQNLSYLDKVKGGDEFKETQELLTVAENVDRVYKSTKSDHKITGAPKDLIAVVQKENLPDTVVWNPWAEKAAGMSDFGDNEYPQMICVEAGYVANRYVLEPKGIFQCGQTLKVLPKSAV